MGWLDNFQSLAKIDKLVAKFIHVDVHNTTVNINVNAGTSPQDLIELKELVRNELETSRATEGFIIDGEKQQKQLEAVDAYAKDETDKVSKEFVMRELPVTDKAIWFSALLIRQKMREGVWPEVAQLKEQIVTKSGDRGRNIANLCTADYLEDLVIPLRSQTDKKELFLEIYEDIVVYPLMAVFVSHYRTPDQIKTEILDKICQATKYGWHKISVHGIGEENARTIKKISVEIEQQCPEVTVSDIQFEGRVITLTFQLQK